MSLLRFIMGLWSGPEVLPPPDTIEERNARNRALWTYRFHTMSGRTFK